MTTSMCAGTTGEASPRKEAAAISAASEAMPTRNLPPEPARTGWPRVLVVFALLLGDLVDADGGGEDEDRVLTRRDSHPIRVFDRKPIL